MTILVTGGRAYADAEAVDRALAKLSPTLIVHGGATGADALADAWARDHGVPVRMYRISHRDWLERGSAAGPIRNRRMLVEAKPALVVAFPGGRGTADCVRQARALGVEVVEIPAGECGRIGL